jgi:N4-gp56 family major capsid protein
MADTLTNTSGAWAAFVQTAFDTTVNWYLNDMPWFRDLVDKRPVSQAMAGNVVTLSIHGKLAPNAVPLTEGVDPDAQAMPSPRQVSVTLQEYGNVVLSTEKLTRLAFTQSVIQDIGREIATNLNESIDLLYKNVVDTGTNKLFIDNTGAFNTLGTTGASTFLTSAAAMGATTILTNATIPAATVLTLDGGLASQENVTTSAVSGAGPFTVTITQPLLNAHAINAVAQPITNPGGIVAKGTAACVSLLRRRKSAKRDGVNYLSYLHPDVSFDLRNEVSGNAWINPRNYVDPLALYNGEVGTFAGARYIESPRCTVIPGTPTTYNTYYAGVEAVVECVAVEPEVRIGLRVDKLQRNQPVGWYCLLGATVFRQNALQILRTASSISTLAGGPATFDPKA